MIPLRALTRKNPALIAFSLFKRDSFLRFRAQLERVFAEHVLQTDWSKPQFRQFLKWLSLPSHVRL